MFVRRPARSCLGKDDERGLGSAIAGIIVLAVILSYYLLATRARDWVYNDILEDITTMGEFAEDGELLMEMADRAHASALLRNSLWCSPLREETYIEDFFEEIVRDAHFRDRKDLQGPLLRLQRDFRRRKG